MSAPAFLVVCNPENRRFAMFRDAALGLGLPEPRAVAWRDVLRDPSHLLELPDQAWHLRIDSLGEDAAVMTALLDRGRERARGWGCDVVEAGRTPAFGELVAPRQAHLGFESVLDDLERVLAERPHWVQHQPIATIRTCFDKDATARVLSAAGVAVPQGIPCRTAADVLTAQQRHRRALWVKLTCGSSASGLGVLRGRNPHFLTTLRQIPAGRFNSLRLVRLRGAARDATLDWLLCEGARVEVDLPKARLDGCFLDLRVLVIRGEPRFAVVRQSPHGITNLHLGGRRGSLDAVWQRAGPEGKEAVVATCRAVGRALPHWYLGVDVRLSPAFDAPAVFEVNAFGDLLPRLENAGLDTYGAEIAAILPAASRPVLHLL
jgi:hypothetical protein